MVPIDHIRECVRKVERDEGVRVLYACEAGSRAWGFASDDSDYDVRFVYARPTSQYLSLRELNDTIRLPMTKIFDINGWDVRKFLSLMRRSNPSAYEWLGSPIIYMEDTSWQAVRNASCQCFSPLASTWHYIGVTRSSLKMIENGHSTPKNYLYAIRSILAARWPVTRGVPAPVVFDELWNELPQEEIADSVANLLDKKRSLPEHECIGRDKELIAWCYDHVNDLAWSAHNMKGTEKCSWDVLDDVFRRTVGI